MKPTDFLKYGMCGLLTGSTVNATEIQKRSSWSEHPNILLILADDLGYGDLSCQGAADLKTPNIDHIFQEGVKFSNFYANSCVCSPSRAALLTGCYPDMVGVPGLIRDTKADNWGYLTPGATLLPSLLKASHYRTAMIGKWNLGLESPNLPNDRGFDQYYGFLDDMMDDYYTHLRNGKNFMQINRQTVNPSGHATEVFTNWALDYLRQQEKKKGPFFLYLAYNAPHDPIQPPNEWLAKVVSREPQITERRAKMVALIEHLDYHVGRVLDQLKSSGQLEHTLIIFTSDNGGNLRFGANNGSSRGGKQDMYEGGIRVPAAIMWKNKIKPGQVADQMVMLMDLLPTLCDLTGSNIFHPVDGISILPLLQGKPQDTDNRTVYFMRREGNMRYGGLSYYAARFKQHKILQNTPGEPMQFFNITDDPFEKHPLEEDNDKDYRQLFMRLTEHIRLSGAIPWEAPSP